MKKIIKNTIGYFLIGIGIVLLLIPILPGWLFIILGLFILGKGSISEMLKKLKKRLICMVKTKKQNEVQKENNQ